MEQLQSKPTQKAGPTVPAIPSVERRMFLRAAGLFSVSTAALLASCQKEVSLDPKNSGARTSADGVIDLGSGDIGILNYAYALEQLESAFYTMAVEKMFADVRGDDKQVLMDIHDHEVIHREFFKAALGSAAIPTLDFDFTGKVDFSNRQEVFNLARQLEDTGVGAYNGAGRLLTNATYLGLAGKIVSVEARHASLISLIVAPGTELFAGDYIVNNNGLDNVLTPAQVLPIAQSFIKQTLSGNNLPNL